MLELKKLLFKQYSLFILLFLLIIKTITFMSSTEYQIFNRSEEFIYLNDKEMEVYSDYLQEYQGKITDDVIAKVEAEKRMISELEVERINLHDQFEQGTIAEQDFMQAISEIEPTYEKREAFKAFYADFEKWANEPEKRYIIAGKTSVFNNQQMEYLLILALFTLIVVFFTTEQSTKMELLLKTTPRGGVFAGERKFIAVIALIAIYWGGFFLVELSEIVLRLGANTLTFPAQSITTFYHSNVSMSIFGVFCAIQLTKLLGYLFWGLLVGVLAQLTKRVVLSVFIPSSIIFLMLYFWTNETRFYTPLGLLTGQAYFTGTIYIPSSVGDFVVQENIPMISFALLCSAVLVLIMIFGLIICASYRSKIKRIYKYKNKGKLMAFSLLLIMLFSGCQDEAKRIYTYNAVPSFDTVYTTQTHRYEVSISDEGNCDGIIRTTLDDGVSVEITREFDTGGVKSMSIMSEINGAFYYVLDDNIHRIDLTTFEETIVFQQTDPYKERSRYFNLYRDYVTENRISIRHIFALGDTFYFNDEDGKLYKLNGMNKAEMLIDTGMSFYTYSFDGKAIYFISKSYQAVKFAIGDTEPTILSSKFYNTLILEEDFIVLENSDGVERIAR